MGVKIVRTKDVVSYARVCARIVKDRSFDAPFVAMNCRSSIEFHDRDGEQCVPVPSFSRLP